jgi:hypothetical protein
MEVVVVQVPEVPGHGDSRALLVTGVLGSLYHIHPDRLQLTDHDHFEVLNGNDTRSSVSVDSYEIAAQLDEHYAATYVLLDGKPYAAPPPAFRERGYKALPPRQTQAPVILIQDDNTLKELPWFVGMTLEDALLQRMPPAEWHSSAGLWRPGERIEVRAKWLPHTQSLLLRPGDIVVPGLPDAGRTKTIEQIPEVSKALQVAARGKSDDTEAKPSPELATISSQVIDADEEANQRPPEDILHFSLMFGANDARARCLQLVEKLKSNDPAIRNAAIRLIAVTFGLDTRKFSKYGALADAILTWGANNRLGPADKEDRDAFRSAVEAIIMARNRGNNSDTGLALAALLDLDLPIYGGESNDVMLARWRKTWTYQHLTGLSY